MMTQRALRLLILFWLGWYLSGPICESVDSWDGAGEEVQDILFHAGGALTVLAAGFSAGIAVVRRLRQLCRTLGQTLRARLVTAFTLKLRDFSVVTPSAPAHSPPVPLRI